MLSSTVFHSSNKTFWATTLVILLTFRLQTPPSQVVSSLASGYYLQVWYSRIRQCQLKFIINRMLLQTPTVTWATALWLRRPSTRDAIFLSAWAPTRIIKLIVKVSNLHSTWMAYRDQMLEILTTDTTSGTVQSRQLRMLHMMSKIANTERVGKVRDHIKVNCTARLLRTSIQAI